jgi:hypothetical protein
MFVTRIKLHLVLLTVLAATASAITLAVADNRGDDAQWPNVAVDEAQWPNIPADKLPEPLINPKPSFLDADHVGQHQLCVCQRRSLLRQPDLDARLARTERSQR